MDCDELLWLYVIFICDIYMWYLWLDPRETAEHFNFPQFTAVWAEQTNHLTGEWNELTVTKHGSFLTPQTSYVTRASLFSLEELSIVSLFTDICVIFTVTSEVQGNICAKFEKYSLRLFFRQTNRQPESRCRRLKLLQHVCISCDAAEDTNTSPEVFTSPVNQLSPDRWCLLTRRISVLISAVTLRW